MESSETVRPVPDEVPIRRSVRSFAQLMERTLRAHDDERGEEGWLTNKTCTVHWLLNRLFDEVNELKEAFDECAPEEVQAECADVANFAMMIESRIRHIKESDHASTT